MFEVGIGTSQNWDPEKAAEEAIEEALKKLSNKPTFALLFSTIHYEKNKGFQKILNKIYTKIPEETELIGGTVAGFMNNSGAYTRGITLLLLNSDKSKIVTGIGHNTKRSPKKAAKTCVSIINKKIEKIDTNEYNTKFILEFISAGKIFSIPFLGRRKIISIPNRLNNIISPIINPTLEILNKLSQIGNGREDEVLEELVKSFKEYTIIGGSTLDDNQWNDSYQFYKKSINKDSLVCAVILTNEKINAKNTLGLIPTGKKLKATKIGLFNCAIEKIEGKPATSTFLEKLSWPKDFLNESLHRKTLYYPLCYEKEGKVCSRVLALVAGENLIFTNTIEKEKELEIYYATGKNLIDAIEPHLQEESKFSLYVSCCARLEALGRNILKIHKRINEKNEPFLLIYMSGEDLYSPGNPILRFNESFNSLKIN
ncbi:MAG: hypothetical protein JW703_00855 [Candidatus Diapherotrites archaeon]|nr:hypothetical protein [Candidatus Diapherotrites archaeon]